MNADRRAAPQPAETSPVRLSDASRARELGAFLRARRESIDPQRLGLPSIGRRRTPGLRRDDVALLADISVTWYTRLEQGRPIRASAKVLGALASALQCSAAETQHLYTLAGLNGHGAAARAPTCEQLSAYSQAILDRLDPFPALIQNARFTIIGFNQAYRRLVGVDIDALPKDDRNCLYLALTNPTWRSRLTDWDDVMQRSIAMFRSAMAEHANDPLWQQQLQRYFEVSDEFRKIWQRYEVRGIENQVKGFRLPGMGVINLQQTNWWSAPKNGDRLLVYVPADERSARCLQRLAD